MEKEGGPSCKKDLGSYSHRKDNNINGTNTELATLEVVGTFSTSQGRNVAVKKIKYLLSNTNKPQR